MYLVDYHTHPYGHGEKDKDYNILKKYIEKAEKMNLKELGFSDHDEFFDKINWQEILKLKNSSEIKLKLGIEIDYIPGEENKIKDIIKKIPFDYCIGSVHKIGEWPFDHPDYKKEYQKRDIDDIYKSYFEYINKEVLSGLFDIVGHLDLIKVFNYKPSQLNVLELVEPVLKNIKKKDLVIEVNTNGLNKPVKEIYPAENIIKRAFELNIPVTLGSDAHNYQRVGENLLEMVQLLKNIGYKKIATFSQRKRIMQKI